MKNNASEILELEKKSLYERVNGKDGYVFMRSLLQKEELHRIRQMIRKQWLHHIQDVSPNEAPSFADLDVDCYHERAHLLDHHSIWSKKERTLSAADVKEFRAMSLFRTLESEFGKFAIADVEKNGWEEIYWRLVRPNEPMDVGPLHADKWFWDVLHQPMMTGTERIKIWIAIYCEPGLSGLNIAPGTHLHDYPYHAELRNGIQKPRIDVAESHFKLQLFDSSPGDAILFHDKLIHGGAVTKGNLTRINLEFTLLVSPSTA